MLFVSPLKTEMRSTNPPNAHGQEQHKSAICICAAGPAPGGLGGQPRAARLGEGRPIRGGPPDWDMTARLGNVAWS